MSRKQLEPFARRIAHAEHAVSETLEILRSKAPDVAAVDTVPAGPTKRRKQKSPLTYELDPCPFCGWRVQKVKHDQETGELWFVECPRCRARGPAWCNTERVIHFWCSRSHEEFKAACRLENT